MGEFIWHCKYIKSINQGEFSDLLNNYRYFFSAGTILSHVRPVHLRIDKNFIESYTVRFSKYFNFLWIHFIGTGGI